MDLPPPNTIDLGEGHRYRLLERDGQVYGAMTFHVDKMESGSWCAVGLTWAGDPVGGNGWHRLEHVPSLDPLTVDDVGSIECACGDEGYIRSGQWHAIN